MSTIDAAPFRLEDYRPTPYAIDRTHMLFELEEDRTRITATLDIAARDKTQAGLPLVLNGDELKLVGIKINGNTAGTQAYHATPQRLEIFTPPADPFTLELVTEICPAQNSKLMGLYRSNGVFCTQCEAEGFRRITYFYDRPDVMSIFTVRLEACATRYPVLLSNGNLKSTGFLPHGRHFAIWEDPFPKPAYLFALVAGDFDKVGDTYQTSSGLHVDLAIYVEKGKAARAHYAMDALKRSMRWDEEMFGREYDLAIFNIVAVSDFNMGAMENKGLNIFNDKYVLAGPDSETDGDYAGVERVIAHEYFHNWTGNRITCRDWFQLCLKEGLTVFRDQEFSSDARSKSVGRIENVRTLQAAQFPEDSGPLAHPVRPRQYREINNFYTTTIYEKGAELVRMVATLLGKELFCAGMDLYFERHDGQACTVEDFITCFADVSGQDFSQFMLWYEQAGTPHLQAEFDWDEEKSSFTIHLSQSLKPTPEQEVKQPMLIPVRFGLIGEDGKDMSYQKTQGDVVGDLLLLREEKQSFIFSNLKSRPVPSLLRDFSAPVTLNTPLGFQELAFLARHDSNQVNRWLSLNRLLLDSLTSDSREFARQTATQEEKQARGDVIELVGLIATDERLDSAFRAMALALPSESEIARALAKDVNPDHIFKARNGMIDDIARVWNSDFTTLRETTRPRGNFSPDAQSAGRRMLANILLDYVSAANREPDLAGEAYNRSDNMSDRISSLRILCQRFWHSDFCVNALKNFERRFATDALVMDKWFAIQVSVPGDDALDVVKTLARHPAYDGDNPNRVRSLFGAFAGANQTGFHRLDGKAYDYFCDEILKLDKKNPQLAARLLTMMRSWRALEKKRRGKMESSLHKIAQAKSLSTDMADIISRMLAPATSP